MKKTHFDALIVEKFNLKLVKLIERGDALMGDNNLKMKEKIVFVVLKNLLQWFRSLMKRINFYNSTKSEVDASGFEPVDGLVRLVTESLAWIIRGCEFENKTATKLMVQVETENRTNSSLFGSNV
jgi:hypothetical protein